MYCEKTQLIICSLHAAAMFLLCAVKVPEAVSDMLMSEFHHPETVQRLNAILKFHTLWRFRYQVWPRMEEGAQQIFKVDERKQNISPRFTVCHVGKYTST